MAIEQELEREEEDTREDLSDDEEQDLEIALLLGERLLESGGYDVIEQSLQSKDPSQVIGQFFIQLIQQLMEQMPKDAQLSPRIFLADGGFVEQLMDLIIDETGLDRKIADRAEIYIGSTIQQMAQSNAQKEQQAPTGEAPMPTAPVMPGGA